MNIENLNKCHCNFCGRGVNDVRLMFPSPDERAYICDECAEQIYGISQLRLEGRDALTAILDDTDACCAEKIADLPTPHELKAYLDEYVIGQDYAKKVISTAVYNHYKRVFQDDDGTTIDKANVFVFGGSGCGKTHIAKTIAKRLNVPFTIVDATAFTVAGYVGEDVESIITRVLEEANFDVKKAERSIIVIDEIDKIARKSGRNPSITKEVNGEGVQHSLLKLLEGSEVNVPAKPGRKNPNDKFIKVNTKNILFICCGAFEGIDKIIEARMGTKRIGFEAKTDAKTEVFDKNNYMKHVTTDDLKDYGIIPEMLGRIPVMTYVNKLDAPTLRRILTEPKNSIIKQYTKLFAVDGVKLKFEDKVFDYIVDYAIKTDVGARGLRTIVEKILLDAMYDCPSIDKDTFKVTLKYAKAKLEEDNSEFVA